MKYFKYLFIIGFLVIFSTSKIYADNSYIISRTKWGADDYLVSKLKYNSTIPKKVSIDTFQSNDKTYIYSPERFIQGLYFYNAIYNKQDLPFNYAIGWDGTIYEGVKGTYKVTINEDKSASLHVAYLDNGMGLTSGGEIALNNLLIYLNSVSGIGSNDISSGTIQYQLDKGNFVISTSDKSWDKSVKEYVSNSLNGKIPQITSDIEKKIQINSIKKEINNGNTLLDINISNKSNSILGGRIYAGSDEDSKLYVKDKWISSKRSNFTTINYIKNGQSTDIKIIINSKVSDGEYKLNLYTDDSKITNSDFTVKINGENLDFIIPQVKSYQNIQILDTGIGYLNVRNKPSLAGNIISKVNVGDKFDVIDTSSTVSGKWYYINYKDNLFGWIDSRYTK